MKSLTNNMMSYVIDACTLINLLRVDEDDNFLYKHLLSLDMHISETVYNEIKKNVFKNAISEVDAKRIRILLPSIPENFKLHQDEEIKNDVGFTFFEEIRTYVGHVKKNNGEFISCVLALILSRCNESKVCFLTDDYPAKKEFTRFFKIQQIGLIEDSIDLLLMLYWLKSDFSRNKLETILFDLKTEYHRTHKAFVSQIISIKTKFKKGENVRKIIDNIEKSFYYSKDPKKYEECLKSIESVNIKEIKQCLSAFPNLSKQPKLAEKADSVLKELKLLEIYKLA